MAHVLQVFVQISLSEQVYTTILFKIKTTTQYSFPFFLS